MSGRPAPITWHRHPHRRDCPATAGVIRFAAERLRYAAETATRLGYHREAEGHLWAAERLECELAGP